MLGFTICARAKMSNLLYYVDNLDVLRRVGILLVAIVSLAVTASAGSATSTAVSDVPEASRAALPVVPWCEGRRKIRPRTIIVACGDGNFFVANLRWSRWTRADAFATGIGHQNLCVPDCARGHFHAYPIEIRLFRPITCHTAYAFTRAWYRYTRAKPPPPIRRTATLSFLCG